MCGLCGIAYADPTRVPNAEMLRRMAAEIRHRGPDSDGYHAAPGIGLGFRRLGIIDLETGDQPLTNEDGSVVLACNGEIYNADELRNALQERGHRFQSRSDAEVIVHLYEELGVELLRSLRGMFAFALWDRSERRLMLARDRFGIKPLNWTTVNGALLFGSEVKSILASDQVEAEIEPEALRDLFTVGFVVGPRTFFRGIKRLQPGHFMLYQRGECSTHRYWRVEFPTPGGGPQRSAREWEELLRDHLEESVRLHLRSDVDVGAWLSPGLDSSTVVALARRFTDRPIRAFTVAFEDVDCDERSGRTILSDYADSGIVSTDVTCRMSDFELYPNAIWHTEDPTNAGLEVPRMVMSEAAARSVKVVITGEGADEVFGGYSWYAGEQLLQPLSRLPLSVRRWIAGRRWVESRWPGGSRVLVGSRDLDRDRYLNLIRVPDGGPLLPSLLSPDLLQRLPSLPEGEEEDDLPDGYRVWPPFTRLQYHDLTLRLPNVILHRVDRASMAHSLEVRVPFLDHHLVEFCAGIPPSLKLRWRREKYILRRAVRRYLPREIVNRRKRGLRAPVRGWLQGRLPEFADHLMSERSLRDKGYFEPKAVARLHRDHMEGHPDVGRLFLGVLAVQVWDEIFRGGWRPSMRTP